MVTVVVLGGSYVGLTVAHRLLKKTLPTVKDLKVVLVNPADQFFFNIATPRSHIPGAFDESVLYQDIPAGFAYAGKAFDFVQGKAEGVDVVAKTVVISSSTGTVTQSYDYLVIATGSNTADVDMPWKANGLTLSEIKANLKKVQDKVRTAKSIVVGGAGATGVATASELGYEYGKSKDITLVTSGATILRGSPLTESQISNTDEELKKLNVKIVLGTKITAAKPAANGKTELVLSNGTSIHTDLYLGTTGLVRATSYLPKSMLDEHGGVIVDETLQAKNVADVFAAGDVLSIERPGIMIATAQATQLHSNLDAALRKLALKPYKIPAKDDSIGVVIGRGKGVGVVKGFRVPSFMIWFVKGRDYFASKAKGYADGTGV